jgi:predicted small metal-binding protein
MVRNLLAVLFTVVLAVTFSSLSFAQDTKSDTKRGEAKMQEMKKEAGHKEMGELKVGSCSPECGFMVRSHNEAEVADMLKMHAKKQHNMDLSDADAKAKIKSAGHAESPEVRKEVIRKETMKKDGAREEKKE